MDVDFLKVALGEHVAVEERSDGEAQKEIELVYYARLDVAKLPATQLREAQEQWSIKIAHSDENAAKGDIRVRKTDFYDDGDLGRTEYVLTTKVRLEDGTTDEIPIQSTVDQFEHFKKLAANGMHKVRHTYPIDGTDLAWEVDCFVNPQGGFHPWVKIDLELPEGYAGGIPEPEDMFEIDEIIKGQNGKRLPAEEQQVRDLYETMFLTKNPGAKEKTPKVDAEDEQDDNPVGHKPAVESEWTAAWPELDGTPVSPDLVPGAEIFEGENGEVRSEPDESKPVVGVEQMQEFKDELVRGVSDLGARLVKLSEGRGYLPVEEMMALLAQRAPERVVIDRGGVGGSNFYYLKDPAPGGLMMGVGFHMNHPTLSSDQVQF
jgi:hypothetical protein